MPPVYAVVSFFSYRFFRSYTYYSLAETGMSAAIHKLIPLTPAPLKHMRCALDRTRPVSLLTHSQAVTISAFLFVLSVLPPEPRPICKHSLLLVEYVASTASGHSAENALMRKDKKALPFPVRLY